MASTVEEPSTEPPQLSREGAAAAELKTESRSRTNRTNRTNGTNGTNGIHNGWTPSSWTTKPIKQDVTYADRDAVDKALAKLERLPPLVTPFEICKLKKSLQDVALGKTFLLQGGDCAELFDYCEESAIESKIKLLLQMSLVLIWGAGKPVVRIARMAGQFAKPRSSPMEIHRGKEIHSFRGDNINGFDPSERTPDPARLVSAYFHSASTLNFMRASLSSGIADLHRPLDWGLGHVRDEKIKAQYARIVETITESLAFMQTVGANGGASGLETVDLYTSHEGLLLEYEQCFTRLYKIPQSHATTPPPPSSFTPPSSFQKAPRTYSNKKAFYNTSTHFIWVGDRTRQLTGAHVEYFRGIANPIGIKVGPSMTASELAELLDIVNPDFELGKVTLITRYGASKIESLLPAHISATKGTPHWGKVIWQCDPMHGNTHSTPQGIKTRSFESILSEVSSALKIHQENESFLGGVHLELTGEAVTECVGGSEGLTEGELTRNYTTYCDPRLNEKQALELAFLVAGFFRGHQQHVGKGNEIKS